MKERLELVTDFASLRAGMITVTKSCRVCGRDHRGMLIRLVPGEYVEDGRSLWERLPNVHGNYSDGRPVTGVGHATVSEGRAFRVIDGMESSETTRKRKAVRA